MREMGIAEDEIKARQRLLERDVIQNTALSLQEHFVLQKIAELEKIDVDEETLDAEIESLADQRGESPRRLRAQLERDNLMESIANQLVERLALNLILGCRRDRGRDHRRRARPGRGRASGRTRARCRTPRPPPAEEKKE